MYYISTRGKAEKVNSAGCIKAGLASDGGLYVPVNIPILDRKEIIAFKNMEYRQIALEILKKFLTDYSEEELKECIGLAYNKNNFKDEKYAPLKKLDNSTFVLELWHGPTCAFKDMALQLMPKLLSKALSKTNDVAETVILVATSGDTGKAALEGFKNVEGIKILVFFPDGGVSQIQKLQMVTQEGSNVGAIAVRGNFDDTQNGVKAIFSDVNFNNALLEKGIKLSSANSINWGRLVPQIVYYVSAYARLLSEGEINEDQPVNFLVPTGNFGNILAAYYAKEMGIPVNKLICASNSNNVLTEFIKTGIYNRKRDFLKTMSPSMDILISSNLERLLFLLSDMDADMTVGCMKDLTEKGLYEVGEKVGEKISSLFYGGWSNEEETEKAIVNTWKDYGYLIDTHTAVGIDVYNKYRNETGDKTKTILASTASPFKFSADVVKALFGIGIASEMDEAGLLLYLSEKCSLPVPDGLAGLDKKHMLHNTVCNIDQMKKYSELFINSCL